MIILNSEHLQQMKTHAQKTYPQECCGLILGTITPQFKQVLEIREAENSWSEELGEILSLGGSSKNERFFIAPELLLSVQKEVRLKQWSIIGIYHSHPDHQAIPSECDRRMAWAEYSYIILSVLGGQVEEYFSWLLDDNHQFCPEIIQLTK